MVEDEFVTRVFDSMSYSSFVVDRGPPFRVCDIFDEVSFYSFFAFMIISKKILLFCG